MDKIGYLRIQLENIARLISCEVARVHDVLTCLACHSRDLIEVTPRDDEAVERWLADQGFAVGEDGFFLALPELQAYREGRGADTAISYSWPPGRMGDSEARHRMYCHRNMGPVLKTLHRRFRGVAWIYYQDATNTALQYPYIDQITAITPDFQWSEYHTWRSVIPEVNAERTVRWTLPSIDYAGQGLIISASAPVYLGDRFVGLWSMDVPVARLVRPEMLARTVDSQLTAVVDSQGIVISSNRNDLPAGQDKGEMVLAHWSDLHTAFAGLSQPRMFVQGAGRLDVSNGRDCLLLWETVPGVDWLCVTVVDRCELVEHIGGVAGC